MDSRVEATRRAGRFIAPAHAAIDAPVWRRPPLAQWCEEFPWLAAEGFPTVEELDRHWPDGSRWRFVEQTSELLGDGLHYEQRIAQHGEIATRADNWHDLFNALIWLGHADLKAALNARQHAEIAHMGLKARSRAQCALTHFDEAGVIVTLRDPALLALWDAHDWHGLFWRERAAWRDGRIAVSVFGHALLEHALSPHQLLVGKTVVLRAPPTNASPAHARAHEGVHTPRAHADAHMGAPPACDAHALARVAQAIGAGEILDDPQELRPLPLSGIPGWHADNDSEGFYRTAPCFRPLRAGRTYPAPMSPASRDEALDPANRTAAA